MNNNMDRVGLFLQMVRSGGNPQTMMMQMLESQSANNPFMQNLLTMAKSGNGSGVEQIARNVMKEKGLDFDSEFAKFRSKYNL